MTDSAITVLGAGNTGFAAAAKLALGGFSVTLGELPEFREAIAGIEQTRTIHLESPSGLGFGVLSDVTTDLARALRSSDLVLVMVPAYAHRPFATACVPHLRPGQVVVLMPGTLGTLEWARILAAEGVSGVTLAEVDTSPYVCRKTGPDRATIWGVVTGLGIGVMPSAESERVVRMMVPLFPGIAPYSDVVECGLSSLNPVVHPAGVLMNAGRIEYSKGDFYFYEEGVTPSVATVVMAVDEERRRIGTALGYRLLPVNEAFHKAGFGPAGDLWSTINGSRMLTRLKAPGSMNNRWLTEDLPYGIATWARLGSNLGVESPLMQALVELGSVVAGFDAYERGRSLDDLGIKGMTAEEIRSFAAAGRGRHDALPRA